MKLARLIRDYFSGIILMILVSRWFCDLRLLFMSERKYRRTQLELAAQDTAMRAALGLPARTMKELFGAEGEGE